MTNMARRRFLSASKGDSLSLLPWLKSADNFYDNCSRCGLCIDSCETQIIIKSEAGFPKVDFSAGECSFCYQCAHACQLPLFKPQADAPWRQKISIDSRCLALNQVTCRSCEDACETSAIRFIATLGGPSKPSVDSHLCNGCGACIRPCPTQSINIISGENCGN